MRIDAVSIPITNDLARVAGFDLDDDGNVDNQAGKVAGALQGQIDGLDLSRSASVRLANDVTWFVTARTCSNDDAMISIGPTADATPQLTGHFLPNGRIHAAGNDGELPVTTMFDPTSRFASAGWLRAQASAVELHSMGSGRWEGRVGMAFDGREMLDAITTPLAPYFTERGLFMQIFDNDPKDGIITVAELQRSTLVKSLLAPDLGEGSEPTMTSFGIVFSASEVH